MSISRQFREELAKDFAFIIDQSTEIVPIKRGRPASKGIIKDPSRSSSPSPASRVSAKSQIEQLKKSLDLDLRQKKVEEYRKKAMDRRKIMTKEPVAKPNTPEFGKKKSCHDVRAKFPKQLLEEFPFLNSPYHADEELLPLFTLFDANCAKSDVQNAISKMMCPK